MKLNKVFIKSPKKLNKEFSFYDPAVRFRRKFFIQDFKKAEIYVCGLGYGYYYINGEGITKDKFTAPVSDYRKTIWYNKYDVTKFLKSGENVFCALLGNGFLNESFETAWDLNKAKWRDTPKLFVTLVVDGQKVFESDDKFKCSFDECIYFNQLRSGEYWDYTKEEDWKTIDYDDTKWNNVIYDGKNNTGKLRKCNCQPIRECKEFCPRSVYKKDGKFIVDFGQNFSGYLRIEGNFKKGQEITLFHVEEIDENFNTMLNETDVINHLNIYAKSVPFQTDKIVCGGNKIEWTPLFTYHGFRYVEISGMTEEEIKNGVKGIFVHQDVKRTAFFECSNPILNKIYENGIYSTYSNMFYSLTDCPTREKLGWLNDSSSSVEQVLLNFDSVKFFEKWLQDIYDQVTEDGNLTGIAPSNDWGYNFGGVCTIALAEIPYKLYLKTQDIAVVKKALPYIEKHFRFYENKIKDNNSGYWLGDWTGSYSKETPVEMIEKFLALKFLNIIIFFRKLLKLDTEEYQDKLFALKEYIFSNYFNDGYCKYDNFTAISMCIVEKVGDVKKLKEQIEKLYEKHKILDCGMVGIQYVYEALSIVNRGDIALDLITNENSFFKKWIDGGATTLYESYDENPHTLSLNHHMFSNVIGWFFSGILGIKFSKELGKDRIDVQLDKSIKLNYAKGSIKLNGGEISINLNEKFIEIVVKGNLNVFYNGEKVVMKKEVAL